MDIVIAAGYNAGELELESEDIRRGRNESSIFSKGPSPNDKLENDLKLIQKRKINCGKIIGYTEWFELLSKTNNVKVLAPNRNRHTRQSSAKDMLLHLHKRQRILTQTRILEKRDRFLSENTYEWLPVSFEKLIDRELEQFEIIAEFLGFTGPVDKLIGCVDDRTKFKG